MSYTELRSDVADMFADFPFVDATITRKSDGTPNARQGTVSAASTQTIPCRAVETERVVKSMDGVRSVFYEIVLNVEPKVNDVITIGAHTLKVYLVRTTAPDGNAISHIAEATR